MKLDGKTNAELVAMREALEALPENQMPLGNLWKYTPAARKKFDAIACAITENMRIARTIAGDPVSEDGYSGRQTKR